MANSNSGITPVKRFFALLKEEKSQVYSIYFYAVLNGLITLSLPLGIQAILNFILGGRITTSWVILVIIVALGVIFSGFLQISQLQIMEKLQQRGGSVPTFLSTHPNSGERAARLRQMVGEAALNQGAGLDTASYRNQIRPLVR